MPNSLAAWSALEAGTKVEVLITRIRFGPGKPHGVALARHARANHGRLHIVFVAGAELQAHTDDLGVFLPMPVAVPDVVEQVHRSLASDGPA